MASERLHRAAFTDFLDSAGRKARAGIAVASAEVIALIDALLEAAGPARPSRWQID